MKAEIDQMTHEEMCRLWRYAKKRLEQAQAQQSLFG